MSDIDLMGALGRSIERARAERKEQKVTEYTPITEEIIRKFATGATWQHQGFTSAEAEIRRWLAAHDAEVRAAVLAEQREPEWEYGTALLTPRGEIWDEEQEGSRADAEDHVRECAEGTRDDDHSPDICIVVRRESSTPGPWLPVEDPS